MMMSDSIRAVRDRLNHRIRDVTIVDEVTFNLEHGDCHELMGDELALWCHRHGLRAWRMERSRTDIVKFGFENREGALKFRKLCDQLAR